MLISGAIALSTANAASPPAPGLEIEILFSSAYRALAKHKSIAAGPLGTYWLVYSAPSAAQAQKEAVAECNKKIARRVGAKVRDGLCESFADVAPAHWPSKPGKDK